jgi:uncharacterized membrane protein YfcA
MQLVFLALIGLTGGALSGLFGIGGGVVIVPLLLLLGYTTKQAAGTSLAALVPPVGLLAAWEYYRAGHVKILDASVVAAGIVVGAFITAQVGMQMPAQLGKQIFGVFLVGVGVKFLFFSR